MERIYRASPSTKAGRGFKDRPLCELCGRPVKVSSDDYLREEILCTHCATEVRVLDASEEEAERQPEYSI
ncbi:MAG: hypothetical protein ACOX3G_09920 [Armatimonadota bacterium]